MKHELALKRDDDRQSSRKSKSKSFHKNWCLNLCDHAVKILCARFTQTASPSDHDIIVLCERALFAISTDGMIKWQKRIEYNPSTMISYRFRTTNSGHLDNLIVANFQNSISIYSQCRLVWSSRLSFSPISLGIGAFGGCKGLQVMLSDVGDLMIGYLGTDPSGYQPVHVENRDPNWEQLENEMKETRETIRRLEAAEEIPAADYLSMEMIGPTTDGQVEWVQSGYVNEQYDNQLVCDSMSRLKTFRTRLKVQYHGKSQYGLSEIAVSIDVDPSFVCSTPMIRIESMDQTTNLREFELIFYVKTKGIPLERECRICAVYTNEDDRMQTNQMLFQLPFGLSGKCALTIEVKKVFLTNIVWSDECLGSTS